MVNAQTNAKELPYSHAVDGRFQVMAAAKPASVPGMAKRISPTGLSNPEPGNARRWEA